MTNDSPLHNLLDNPDFRRWVYAPTAADDAHWQGWLAQHPDQRSTVETARNLLLSVRGDLPTLSDTELAQRIDDLMAQTADDVPARVITFRPQRNWWYAAAAAVLLLVGWFGLRDASTNPQRTAQTNAVAIRRVVVENESGQPRLVNLSDGSSVILQAGSRLTYEQPFRPDRRRVWLTGEAFFEVTKNPRHPFVVQADRHFTTQVLGTSFRIRAYANEKSGLVVVKTGRVAVFHGSTVTRAPEAVLTARQQATVTEKQAVKAVQAVTTMPIERQAFRFAATPLSEVVRSLETAYGVSIALPANLTNCTLTASLGDEPLPQKLHMLCAAIDATYQIDGQQIRLDGPGCTAAGQ